MTVTITRADFSGVPLEARCDEPGCGRWWSRPAGDPAADTLALFALEHDHYRRSDRHRPGR
jgi:hypothetical protein